MTKKTSPVLVEELASKKGKVGVLSLNAPRALNSLSLEMIQALHKQLNAWAADDNVHCVVLEGAGEKAFCAGGDVQKLYQSAIETPGGPCEYAEQFFLEEYQLDHQIHTYPKPVLCIGHGIVMGGGLGLMQGASHRLVTESSRIAMPEITIGLFPDVGGTRFLNDLPNGLGIFFALTGASINATDATTLGLATHFAHSNSVSEIKQKLTSMSWVKDVSKNADKLDVLLSNFDLSQAERQQEAPPMLAFCHEQLAFVCRSESLGEFVTALSFMAETNEWAAKALKTYQQGSPLSALLIFEQLRRHRYANPKEVFESELILATNCVRYPEFAEGVRALLIDKDKKPKWQFEHFSHVPSSTLESFFQAPWGQNPLSKLLAPES